MGDNAIARLGVFLADKQGWRGGVYKDVAAYAASPGVGACLPPARAPELGDKQSSVGRGSDHEQSGPPRGLPLPASDVIT